MDLTMVFLVNGLDSHRWEFGEEPNVSSFSV
jgi:hypothetical protein